MELQRCVDTHALAGRIPLLPGGLLRRRGAVLHEFPASPCHSKPLLDTPPCQPKKSIYFICHVMGEDWYHC